MELISIIVPVYNVEKYLKKCVNSIITQTYTNLEIILVDDGSKDSSGEMCDEFSKSDSRIKVIHRKNGGLSAARNSGIEVYRGKYVTFIDSDDWIEPTYVEYLYYLLKKYNSDVSQCAFRYIDSKKKIYNKVTNSDYEEVYNSKDAIKNLLHSKYLITSAWGKLYKRCFFDRLRYPEGKLFEDIPVTYQVMLDSEKICYGDHALYNYFYNEGSISKSSFNPRRLEAIEFMKDSIEKVKEIYNDLDAECDVALFKSYFNIYLTFENNDSYEEYRLDIKSNLKKYRMAAIRNRNTSKNIRIKALITIFGTRVTYALFKR